MERELHASVSGMQWAVAAYSLAMATLMLYTGSTGDRIGRKRVLVAGIVVFTGASVLCALAPSLPALTGFWILQGVGAAGLNVPLGIAALLIALRSVPESRAERPRRPDPVGRLLVITLLGPLAYGIIEAPHAG
ncbi:MFS transporter [Streptomyces roseoverticillatus]|nr:MFS transporter [Streptomyces roseoverticillatus]